MRTESLAAAFRLKKGAQPPQMSTPTEDLRELQESFRIWIEDNNDILTIRGADGRIRYANSSCHRILGYKREEVIGSKCFDLIHPEDRQLALSGLGELMKTPGARDSVQCRVRHAEGSWISLEVAVHNMLEHPVVRGVVIHCRDISERKRQEAKRERLIEELKQTLAGLNTLAGILPICACCKKIRHESGGWQQLEVYIRDHAQVEFSHGMCPECARLWCPDQSDK